MTIRKDGYYWVKTKDEWLWIVAESDTGLWMLPGYKMSFSDEDLLEIGYQIEYDPK
jgi:hypothetical protein